MTRIIDADGHVVEPRALWEDYAERQFREQMIQIRRNRDGGDELWINGENRSRPSLPVAASMVPGGLSDLERARKLTWDDILPGGYDPHARASCCRRGTRPPPAADRSGRHRAATMTGRAPRRRSLLHPSP